MQVYYCTDMKPHEKGALALFCPGRKAITSREAGTLRCPDNANGYVQKRTSTFAQKTSVQIATKTETFRWPYCRRQASYNITYMWNLKNWCFQIVVLERTLESPLDSKEIKPVHPKGNQPWLFIGRTDAEAEALILWPLDVRSRRIRKEPDDGKDRRREEKGTREDEMVGWHHWWNGHGLDQTPGKLLKDREA